MGVWLFLLGFQSILIQHLVAQQLKRGEIELENEEELVMDAPLIESSMIPVFVMGSIAMMIVVAVAIAVITTCLRPRRRKPEEPLTILGDDELATYTPLNSKELTAISKLTVTTQTPNVSSEE